MRKLNPITALYLKVLEFISFLLIEVGGRIDDYMYPKNLTPSQLAQYREKQRKLRKVVCFWGQWY